MMMNNIKDIYYIPERIKMILQFIKESDKVLDVGCVHHTEESLTSEVWLHKFVKMKAASVIGIDILEDKIKILKKLGYDVMVANAETMNIGKKFNVIVAGEIIEHLSNPGKFLENAHNHLMNEGILLITTPNAYAWHNILNTMLSKTTWHTQHVHIFDRITLMQLVKRHKFSIEYFRYVPLRYGARGSYISRIFGKLGLKSLGGATLFLVAKRLNKIESS
ncbi:MAG: class I SAM-dependent methyltransferase [Candidatus Hodarchaeota archaeon]